MGKDAQKRMQGYPASSGLSSDFKPPLGLFFVLLSRLRHLQSGDVLTIRQIYITLSEGREVGGNKMAVKC